LNEVTLTLDVEANGYHYDGEPFCRSCGSLESLPAGAKFYVEDKGAAGELRHCGVCGAVTFRQTGG